MGCKVGSFCNRGVDYGSSFSARTAFSIFFRVFEPYTRPSAILVDELHVGHRVSSCEFGAQRSVSGFLFALIANSTILLIASARDGTSI